MAAKKKKKDVYVPVDRTIYLTDNSGTIGYGGSDQLTTYTTDTLSWSSLTHAIRIEFKKGASPFKPNTTVLSSGPGVPTSPGIIRNPLKKPKKYPYTATISDGNSIIVEDPVIIIDDDGGGGGGGGNRKRKVAKKATKK
jgi:hypothetical protein